MRIRYWRFLRRRTNEAIELVVHDLTDCEWPSPDYAKPDIKCPVRFCVGILMDGFGVWT
jgi:hypothetical protein